VSPIVKRRVAQLLAVLLVLGATAGVVAAAEEQVIGRPDVTVIAPDSGLEPGTEATLDVFLSNDGTLRRAGPSEFVDRVTTARGTRVTVTAGDAPLTVETGAYPAGRVPPGTSGPFPIRVTVDEDAAPGTYELPVRLRYSYTPIVTYESRRGTLSAEFDESTITRRTTVIVEIDDDARFRVVGANASVAIGDRGDVTLAVRNVGTEPADAASLTVESGSGEVTFGSAATGRATGFVGPWAPGETKRVTYSVRMSDEAARRAYGLVGTVGYEDPSGVERRSRRLTAAFRPRPEQTFALDTEGRLRVGEERTLRGRVRNTGTEPVRSPTLVLDDPTGSLDATEREVALPTLEPGASAPFAVDVSVGEEAAPGDRPLTFRVRYRSRAGDELTSDALDARVPVAPKRDRFRVTPVEAAVPAGTERVVRLRVTNAGDGPVEAVEAKAFANDPLDVTDDTGFVDQLAPNESAVVAVSVSAGRGASRKTYPLSIDFQYDEDGETELSDTHRIGVSVTEPAGRDETPLGLAVVLGALLLVAAGGSLYWRRRGADDAPVDSPPGA
jgi:hypothetical protein